LLVLAGVPVQHHVVAIHELQLKVAVKVLNVAWQDGQATAVAGKLTGFLTKKASRSGPSAK
jgi:hypothetical protein